MENGELVAIGYDNDEEVKGIFDFEKKEKLNEVKNILTERKATKAEPFHATFKFEKDVEAKKIKENIGDGKDYGGEFVIEEIQTEKERNTFMFIFLLTLAFGLLVIILLKKLKKLTHGAEDNEGTIHDEAEGFDIADA